MGLQYRAIRAAASALLVAAAVGTGGMAGMTSALAADPGDVTLTGSLAGSGQADPVSGVHLQIVETHPEDGAVAAFQVTTAVDGTFSASLHPWGTTATPAKITITSHEELEIVGETCSQTWSVDVQANENLPLAEGAPPALVVPATTALLGEVCGTTGTPPPDSQGTGGGRPGLTPPPTDTFVTPARAGGADLQGPAISIGFAAGLLLASVVLLPRPGARRRS